MSYISAKDFVKRKRAAPLQARLLQIAAINAVGNETRVSGVLAVARMRAFLPVR